MKILFPLICFAYAGIFYAFFHFDNGGFSSLFPNTLFNAILFILLAVFFLFSFSSFSTNMLQFGNNKEDKKEKKNIDYYKLQMKDFLLSYSHYLSYIFFYLGVFVLAKFLPGVYFSYCLLFTNIFVFLFFISFRNLSFSLDFLRINQVIFSLIYIGSYIYILFTGNNFFGFIDFLNSFIIIISFLTSLKICKQLGKDNFFIANFYLYIYSFIVFYLSFIFDNNYIFLSVINITLSTLLILVSKKVEKNAINVVNMRAFALTIGYIGGCIGIFYLMYFSNSIFIYLALIVSLIVNFLFHKQYQNYISYFFSVLTFSVLLFVPSFGNIDGSYNYIFILFLSYFLLGATFFFDKIHEYDIYFLHFMSYIYNGAGIIFFLVFYGPNLLEIALLMFLEFLYFFGSYHRLTQEKKLVKNK